MAMATERKMMWLMVVLAVVLAIMPQSMAAETPAFGIVVTSTNAEKALTQSGFFNPTSSIKMFGRTFVSGTIYGANVVFVRTSTNPSVHVGVTVQILADYFKIRGIINYGSAGATNTTLDIGSVFVPSLITFSGAWEWLRTDSYSKGQLQFAEFNSPKNGDNLLGSVRYGLIDVYENGKLGIRQYIPVTANWLRLASRIKEVDSAEVIVGSKSSSSDIFVKNPSYSKFLFNTFGVSTVDTSSAAVGLAAKSYELDFIVFRGISNYAGADSSSASELANANAVKAVIRFIWEATVPRSDI